ncbi:hypothetical protein I4U23_026119 [Adineta vaga]|nr:hypothetical protein I4U23_026119 [Adineta vaga]
MGSSESSPVSEETRVRRRLDIQKIQNVLLIWLDSNIDNNNEDCQNTKTHLRRVVYDLNTYTDSDQCIQFIETIKDRKVCMIISGSLGQLIVPQVHKLSQVDSIFIFCGNKQRHEGWAKDWPKIMGVFTEIEPICEALKQAAARCEQNAVSMSFVTSGKKLDQLDPSFMYTQILKEILVTIKFDDTHIQDYVNYCRELFIDNDRELENVERLEREYHQKKPIWWYTYECFFYRMLNRGIRMMDGDIITRMGFFINDLHRHIESVHQEQHIDKIFTVYRGQGLSIADFEQLKQTKGGLISFNNFLSTSKDKNVSLSFAKKNLSNTDLVAVLFVMTIDPKQSTTAFASIRDLSAIEDEDEVLFSMHSVFRIQDIKQMGGNNKLFEVSLTLTSDSDKELHALTERIREESFPNSEGWYRLGLVLSKLGQNEKAEEIYEMLLDQATKENEKERIYHRLGSIKDNQGEYEEAIKFYQKSLAIKEKTLSPQDPDSVMDQSNSNELFNESLSFIGVEKGEPVLILGPSLNDYTNSTEKNQSYGAFKIISSDQSKLLSECFIHINQLFIEIDKRFKSSGAQQRFILLFAPDYLIQQESEADKSVYGLPELDFLRIKYESMSN